MELDQENPATWKFKWYEALTVGVKPKNLPVAQILLQHCNGPGGLINPSQKLIAHYLGCHVSKVEKAIADLTADGIIEKGRWNRASSNRYRFVDAWRARLLGERIRRWEEWQELREKDPAVLTGREHESDGASGIWTQQD